MRWMLAGCCGLVLINLSVVLSNDLMVKQKPRFYGVRINHNVVIYCQSSEQRSNKTAKWYKVDKYDAPLDRRRQLQNSDRITFSKKSDIQDAYLHLNHVQIEDSGVYFCRIDDIWGPGTEVKAARVTDASKMQSRSRVKDGLMIIQGLLLAVCIAAILLRKRQLLEKKDSIYEEPETDHIYEGLAIETCGGGLYEELTMYSQPEGAEAPWE